MMKIDPDLGRFLAFIAKVNVSIRMNSSYNPESQYDSECPKRVMLLSDMLHVLDELGESIIQGNDNSIRHDIDKLVYRWETDRNDIEAASQGYFDLQEGIDLLKSIESKI